MQPTRFVVVTRLKHCVVMLDSAIQWENIIIIRQESKLITVGKLIRNNCRIPCHFEAVSLKELDTRIRSYPFYVLRGYVVTEYPRVRVVSAYPPIFRGCFKVAGYSEVKPCPWTLQIPRAHTTRNTWKSAMYSLTGMKLASFFSFLCKVVQYCSGMSAIISWPLWTAKNCEYSTSSTIFGSLR